ncbi:hypothetical protein GCM10027046_12160 [Uliginosibacterium flavum]|uniref:Uncharacterized protein n=1 Tax=Uliginosibacterium flavum TaxID=1396831 RepID=A0ABV2TL42_9RHOO
MNDSLERARSWADELMSLLDGYSFEPNERSQLSASFLSLVIRHQRAINDLFSLKHGNSALALLRPQTESLVRGLWFRRCATQAELTAFIKSEKIPPLPKMIASIETTPGYKNGTLKIYKERTYKQLCGFTHGGNLQFFYLNTDGEVRSAIPLEVVDNSLNDAARIALLAGLDLCAIDNRNDLATAALSSYQKIYDSEPECVGQENVLKP